MFRDKIERRRMKRGSSIVLALDPMDSMTWRLSREEFWASRDRALNNCTTLIDVLAEGLVGIKVGYPLLFALGSRRTRRLIEESKEKHDLVFIGDLKVADTANTNSLIVNRAFDLQLDAIIFHLFIGYEGGFDSIVEEAKKRIKGTIGVAYMTQPGASEFFQKNYHRFVESAIDHGVDGLVVPATKPKVIREIREISGGRLLLFAPGIGVQGGSPRETVEAGADYLIVGRSITEAGDPQGSLDDILAEIR